MKLFLGPVEVAGYYANLARGFKEIGVSCDYFTYTPHPFGYGGESKPPKLIKWAIQFYNYRISPKSPFPWKIICAIIHGALIRMWALGAMFTYDVFIFGFGNSLFPKSNFDLVILKALKKTVISNLAHGSEARPPFMDGALQDPEGKKEISVDELVKKSRITKTRIKRHQKYATYCIGAPFSTSQFAEREFINWFALGVPFSARSLSNLDFKVNLSKISPDNSEVCRILHSPSHKAVKGTVLIQKAIESLRKKGYSIEFVMIHKRPFSEVLQEIQKCDFVVDQLYSDTPLAGFATESAWFGKPAVVGGFDFEKLKTLIPIDMWPSSKTCQPEEVEQAIEFLILNKEARLKLGEEAQKFVNEKWNAATVANKFLKIISGDFPKDWIVDPRKITYLQGCGQPLHVSKSNVRKMVKKYGVTSLQLEHRPDLEKAVLEFSEKEIA